MMQKITETLFDQVRLIDIAHVLYSKQIDLLESSVRNVVIEQFFKTFRLNLLLKIFWDSNDSFISFAATNHTDQVAQNIWNLSHVIVISNFWVNLWSVLASFLFLVADQLVHILLHGSFHLHIFLWHLSVLSLNHS